LTSASSAASSQDLNGPRPAGTWIDFLVQGSRPARSVLETTGASLCGCALIYALLLQPDLPTSSIAAWIGRISYSIYLFHGFVIDNPQITGWVEDYVIHINSQMLGYVVAVLLVSLASYHFVERPGIAVGRSLTRNATSHRRAAEAPS